MERKFKMYAVDMYPYPGYLVMVTEHTFTYSSVSGTATLEFAKVHPTIREFVKKKIEIYDQQLNDQSHEKK